MSTMLDRFFGPSKTLDKQPGTGNSQQTGNPGQNQGNKQGQNPNNQEVVTQNNSTNNPDPSQNANNNADPAKSPLDSYSKLWENDPTKTPVKEPLFKLDATKLAEAVGAMDFTKKIDPELRKKALGGDEQAYNAVMNGAAQEAFSQALLASSQMIEGAFEKKAKEFGQTANETFKRNAASEKVLGQNPTLSHPAVKPVFDHFQSQFQKQFPNASSSELASYTEQYMTEFANTILNGGKKEGEENKDETGKNTGGQKEQDWSKFFG